jgi:osmotically inducible lipoprotein OsmB
LPFALMRCYSRANEDFKLKNLLMLAAVSMLALSGAAVAQERLRDGAIGAGSGALVGGPVGAVVGGAIGYVGGPAIGRSIFHGNRRYHRRVYHRRRY